MMRNWNVKLLLVLCAFTPVFATAAIPVVELAFFPGRSDSINNLFTQLSSVWKPDPETKEAFDAYLEKTDEVRIILYTERKDIVEGKSADGVIFMKLKNGIVIKDETKLRKIGEWAVPVIEAYKQYSDDELKAIAQTLSPIEKDTFFWIRLNVRAFVAFLEQKILKLPQEESKMAKALMPIFRELNTLELKVKDTGDNQRLILLVSSLRGSHLDELFSPQPASVFPAQFNSFNIYDALFYAYCYYNNGAALNYAKWMLSIITQKDVMQLAEGNPQFMKGISEMKEGIRQMEIDGNSNIFLAAKMSQSGGFSIIRNGNDTTEELLLRMQNQAQKFSAENSNYKATVNVINASDGQSRVVVMFLNDKPYIYTMANQGWTLVSSSQENLAMMAEGVYTPFSTPQKGSLPTVFTQRPGIFFQGSLDATSFMTMFGNSADAKESSIVYLGGSSKNGKMALTVDVPKSLIKAAVDFSAKMHALKEQTGQRKVVPTNPQPDIPPL